mgnify:CR=1 FL=1
MGFVVRGNRVDYSIEINGLSFAYPDGKQALDDLQHFLARLGQAGQPLAIALENIDAQFFFEFTNLPADTRLRCKQHIGDLGQTETLTDGFAHGAQLLKIHVSAPKRRLAGKHAPAWV